MQWFSHELFLEILLLPAAMLALAHSFLFAYELSQSRSLVPPQNAVAWKRLTVWHAILPLAGIICAGYVLATKEHEWAQFGSADPAEVLLILTCCLGVGLGKSANIQSTTTPSSVVWRVAVFHFIAAPAVILTSVFMSWTVTGLMSIESTVPNQFTAGNPTVTHWPERQEAWNSIFWIATPAMFMSVGIWAAIIAHRRTPARLFHCCVVLVLASTTSFALTHAVQAGPIPVLSKDLPAGVTIFPTRLLIVGGPILLLASGVIAQRMSMSHTTLDLPITQLTRIRRAVLVLTCVIALVTLNWVPIFRSMPWPPPWSNWRWLGAAARVREPEHAPMNLLYLALLVAILLPAFRFLTSTNRGNNTITIPNVDIRSMLFRIPPVFAAIVLTVLSLFWSATGLWSFLTVFT